ncbi:GAF domain-containing protein [Neobacillus sp. LXY-4]|uniref:GAF domain-containing protein n=1 Tax=Neobacillus sp. LXY-4 TaxID=3379826 RepID=UPI003EE13DA3
MINLNDNQLVIKACNGLKEQINCDFVGLAIQNQNGPDIRWHYAVGNLNDKYKRITVRYGKGIAGKVILTGSPMSIVHFPDQINGKAIEYPIMLAEKLISSFAVPIFYKNAPKGVLLVGKRSPYTFLEKEQQMVQEVASFMEEMLSEILS